MTSPAGRRALEALRDAMPTARQAADRIRWNDKPGPEHEDLAASIPWMTAEQAADAARMLGGATFAVCPVCDGHWPDTGHLALAETAVRAHAESHTPREYLEAIARLNTELATLRKPPATVTAALDALDAATETYRQALEAE